MQNKKYFLAGAIALAVIVLATALIGL